MESTISTLIRRYWLFFFFITVFVFMAIFKISFRDIWTAISPLELWQLCLLLSIFLLISLFQIIARKYLLYSLFSSAKLKNLILIHFSSMAAHYSTPAKIGFPLAVYLLNRLDNVPYVSGAAVILIELVVSTGICGIIALIGSFFYFVGTTKTIVVASLCFLSLVTIALFILFLFLKKLPKDRRIYRFIRDTHQAFTHIALPHLMIFLLMRVFIQLLSGINLFLLCLFFSSELSLPQAIVAGSSAFFLGAISMVPMGLGVREASMLFYLHHMGISHEIGLSIVTIQRLLFTGFAFVLGAIFGAILGVKNIKLDSAQEKRNGHVLGSGTVD
jgi:uncharacterized membrane protein YbhN (UPF0104 family)